MRYLILIAALAACTTTEVLDPTGLDAATTASILKPECATGGSACSSERK